MSIKKEQHRIIIDDYCQLTREIFLLLPFILGQRSIKCILRMNDL